MDMFFDHDYARRTVRLRIVYIEYHGRRPHSVIAESGGIQSHFDFEKDCKQCERFMYFNSGTGCSIKEIQGPHYAKGTKGCSYWIHPDAGFGKYKPKNTVQRKEPMKFNGDPNPFNNSREIYRQEYCKVCNKSYDEDACPDHHTVNDDGELVYLDGSKVE